LISQQDDTPVFLVDAGIFKDAPHPNSAKLYLTWYMATGQQNRTGTFSPRSDVPPPAGMERLSTYKIDNGYRKLVSDAARLLDLRRRFGTYVHKR
jgi:ABC-type Fe3+ transport system substrate-binding protein